jgi:predicted Zn-dependent protease
MFKRNAFILCTMAAMAVAFTAPAAGDAGSGNTIVYPSENPVFSITFPDGWETETDENLLHAFPADSSIYLGLWALEEGVKLEDALDALDEIVSSLVTGLETGEAEKNEINGIEIVSVDGSGKDTEGDDVNVSAALFSPDDSQVFILIYYATPAAEARHEDELIAVIGSINKQ